MRYLLPDDSVDKLNERTAGDTKTSPANLPDSAARVAVWRS